MFLILMAILFHIMVKRVVHILINGKKNLMVTWGESLFQMVKIPICLYLMNLNHSLIK